MIVLAAALTFSPISDVLASDDFTIPLVVSAGRVLRVRLDERVSVRHEQPVRATVADAVYAYDRIVIPSGSKVVGKVVDLVGPSKLSRARTILSGDFTPHQTPVLEFDTLVLPDGTEMSIATRVSSALGSVTLAVTSAERSTLAARAKAKLNERIKQTLTGAKQKVAEAFSAVKSPGKLARLKELAVNQLPYHPEYVPQGTFFDASLLSTLEFGPAPPAEPAEADAEPPPDSILKAHLVTALDSAKTPRGTPMRAVLSEPVFSADHRLIMPEGTTLDGEVTFAKRAASWHRNGQLRFLIEGAQAPDRTRQPLLGSLYAVETSEGGHLTVDDEGGASIGNSSARFVAPALAVLALRASTDNGHRRIDHDADDSLPATPRANIGGRGLAGWFGFGLLGMGLGQLSRPAAVAFGIYGAARTAYANIVGKGDDVSFPSDTPIQIQTSPNQPSPSPNQPSGP